ncbi:MAG: electron transport complex subunit E [Lachnospiraceae bacterium]|nr:electron transport complex subunit E [Lachnospiraceae bacterium]
MKTKGYTERLYNGLIKENPTFVLMLGMCPTMAVTSSAFNALGMGLTTTAVLVMSNFVISAMRKMIPDKVRIPAYIVIVATLVTIVQLLLKAYIPSLDSALGIYIPLIVVNCIILGRAESYASKNPPLLSAFDGLGMGLGFTLGLTCIGIFRELLGSGTLFDTVQVIPENFTISLFVMAPGAFFVLAFLIAAQNAYRNRKAAKAAAAGEAVAYSAAADNGELACGGNCLSCFGAVCAENRGKLAENAVKAAAGTGNTGKSAVNAGKAEGIGKAAGTAQNDGKAAAADSTGAKGETKA